MSRRKSNYISFDEMLDVAGEPAPPRRRGRALAALLVTVLLGGAVLGSLAFPALFATRSAELQLSQAWEALPSDLPEVPLAQHTIFLDRNGQEFARFYAEDRTPVELEQVAPVAIDALLAIEDDRFYERGALDFQGLARALAVNTFTDKRQGGSTLTQQLVENTLVAAAHDDEEALAAARAQSLEGKIQEMKYAVELEQTLSKDEILERYLNTVYFGNGAYGISSAARRYFNTTADALTLPQAALLAGLMRSPYEYDPVRFPEAAANRRETVLDRMVSTDRITEEERTGALVDPLPTAINSPPNGCLLSGYPVYCAYVRDQLLEDSTFGLTPEEREENLYRGGITVTTALDRRVSDAAQAAVSNAVSTDNRVAVAEAIVEPGTGYVPAVVQSKAYGQGDNQTEIVYATRPSFQPGSSFKMVTLMTALEQGLDPSLSMTAPTGYKPRGMDSPPDGFSNDSHISYGSLDMYSAARQSVNVYFIKLIERTGVLPAADMARRLGVTSLPQSGPGAPTARSATFTLGAWEVSPMDMASAYATVAANGVACRPTGIVSAVRTATNVAVEVPDTDCHQAVDPQVAKTAADILQGPLGPGGTAEGYNLDRPAAGKTGTTNNYAATWFVGFTPQYATAVWVGDPRGGSAYPLTGVTAFGRYNRYVYGATIAAPVWHDSMQAFSNGLPVIPLGGLNVNQGPLQIRSVPEVRGMTTAQALSALLAAGYQVKISETLAEPDPLLSPDHVFAQSPQSGVSVDPDAMVELTLTAGSRLDVLAPTLPENEGE